ncbi:hypothetical protein [Actinacidiphila glaucinigra]|uniref:Uncharacterized protein n=1 Tax=Actinacidiphila glaucinigra TaxID=235986 RepID=A0A239HER2_9ACTN|nr:hypothetical protein [Actinacidiphila glaucinigra]SNS79518.1 hypothetical protein SAMN05216252_108323 [Actinacidiphila glaucinigra]
MSIVVGLVKVEDLGPVIDQPSSGARYSTVGKLREQGFTVRHTPSQKNPDHATVSVKGDWTAERGHAFNLCFGDPTWVDDIQEQT